MLIIYDATGRIVKAKVVDAKQFELHTENLAAGIYMFVLKSGIDIKGRGKIILN